MGYASYVGRVGALAVALGLGSAIATMPGVAFAAPPDNGSSSSATHETTGDTPSSDEAGAADNTETSPGLGGGDDTADAEDTEDADQQTPTDDAGDDAAADDAAPGGDDDKSTAEGDEKDAASDDSGKQSNKTKSLDARSLRQTADSEPSSTDDDSDVSQANLQTLDVDSDAGAPALKAARTSQALTTMATFSTPPVAVVPAEPWGLDEILEEPHTFVVGLIPRLVNVILQPLMAPLGPSSPGGTLLWTMLAFARDEFRRIALPNLSSDPATPSLVEAPNLLVNPGAELGDPSLSGYASVTVPGWELTGTPTVIDYGTPRRFPVPISSPGPTLPDLLAFPRAGLPGSGERFFGGGPVADSSLTQAVDLSAAADEIDNRPGGVQYQLGGDLGGFLIDPSRAKVSVEFLDANGVSLGTGKLQTVTALDRWFMTDFIHRDVVGVIPEGARSARVVASFVDHNPVLGNYNNAYADNLSFKVDAEGLAPAPLTPPESTVGGLDHVFMVYLENKGVGQIVGSPNAPNINSLIDQYGYASNYYGLTHPSDPNYYPIIGASDFGFNYNCPSNCFPVGTPNLADSIEAAGLNWAGYMDGGGGYSDPTDRLPFLAFTDIYNDPDRVAAHLFDLSQLGADLEDPSTAPNFVWFSADDETNMEGPTDFPGGIFHWVLGFLSPAHQYNVKAGDEFLQGPVETIMDSATWQSPDERSIIVVTFDEDYNNITTGVGNEGNHIVTVVIPNQAAIDSGMRDGHFVADDHYNHYSLLRTIEDSLGVGPLTNNDKYANPMNEFWLPPPP